MKKNYIYGILSALALCIMVAGCGRTGNGKEEDLNNNAGIDSTQSESSAQPESMELQKAEEAEAAEEDTVKEADIVKEVELLEIPEDMLAYWMVLNNKKPFVSMNEDKQEFYLNEYFWRFQDVFAEYHTDHFMVVDMDGDGEEEVVLEREPGTREILHYEDGVVYGCQFAFQGMKRIYESGIYEGDAGAAGNHYLRLTELNKDGYKEEIIAAVDDSEHGAKEEEPWVEESCDHVEPIEDTALAKRTEFVEKKIDRQFLGDLTEQELALVKQIPKEDMLEEEPDYQEDNETLQRYSAALSGEEAIVYVRMDRLPGDYDPRRVYFSAVDMDGDGADELVFTRERGMIEILHDEAGQVYSYQFRPLKSKTAVITTDGVFQAEDLSPTGYARITAFEKDGCKTEPVEDHESGSHERVRYYFYPEEAEKEPPEEIFYWGTEKYLYLLEGDWTAAEYAGAMRDGTFDEAMTEEYQKEMQEATEKVVEKYLGTEYCIEINDLKSLAPYSDFFVIMEDNEQLFGSTRFMPGEFIKMSPPYITLEVSILGEDERYGFIIDADGTVLIKREFCFFRLEKKEEILGGDC